MNGRRWVGFLVCFMLAIAGTAVAKSTAISIPMSEIVTGTGDRGPYYVVAVELPDEIRGKRLDSAFLEFVMDIAPVEGVVLDRGMVVSAFPLTEHFRGSTPVFRSEGLTSQVALLGEDRTLRMDIVDVVKGWLANPSTNHGLVIGSLKGPDSGTAILDSEGLGSGRALRITFFYQNRFGGRVSNP